MTEQKSQARADHVKQPAILRLEGLGEAEIFMTALSVVEASERSHGSAEKAYPSNFGEKSHTSLNVQC